MMMMMMMLLLKVVAHADIVAVVIVILVDLLHSRCPCLWRMHQPQQNLHQHAHEAG